MKELPSNWSENDEVLNHWNGLNLDRIPLTILLTLYDKCIASACQIYHDQEGLFSFFAKTNSRIIKQELHRQLNELESKQITCWQHANGIKIELQNRGVEFGIWGEPFNASNQARDNHRD